MLNAHLKLYGREIFNMIVNIFKNALRFELEASASIATNLPTRPQQSVK
jgi:hypothetical protein